jgi:hypothetical protein
MQAKNRGNDWRICSAALFISRSRDEKFYRLSVEGSDHGFEQFSGAIAKQERSIPFRPPGKRDIRVVSSTAKQ